MRWTAPQQQLVADILDTDTRWVIASGGKGCGKTAPMSQAWAIWTQQWRNATFGVGTPSLQRQQSVLAEFEKLAAHMGIRWHRGKGHIEFGNNLLETWISKTERSHEQVQGGNWAGCYIEEASKLHPNCIREVGSRCRVAPFKAVANTNPDGPLHHLKTDVIDRIEQGVRNGKVHYMSMDDATWYDPETLTEMRAALLPESSSSYKRDWEGLWTTAGGAIYPLLADAIRKPPKLETERPVRCYVGIDPTTVGVLGVILLAQYSRGRMFVTAEWRHSNKDRDAWKDPESGLLRRDIMPRHIMAQQAVAWANKLAPATITAYVVDSADPRFKQDVRNAIMEAGLPGQVPDKDKPELLASFRQTNSLLNTGALSIAPHCGHLVDEMSSASYDAKWIDLTGDERHDESTERHLTDALRYVIDYARSS